MLRSPTAYETLDRAILRPRLLLCLHGIGTNAGLQRMNAAQHGATYKDLVYVRRRYITADQLRQAIATVTNGTLIARNPAIWGEGTTACASDSKHFGAWGPKSDDAMARTRRGPWYYDLLARRAKIIVHRTGK